MDITQSTAVKIPFFLYLASDHLSPATGKTPTVTISKNGAAFAAPAGTVSEVGNGFYVLNATTADTATLGPLLMHVTEASSDTWDDEHVVIVNPVLALLAAVIETNGGVTLTVQQALQLAAALPAGKVAGIVAGTGAQTFTLRSATDKQVIATITGDDLGNKSTIALAIP